MYVVGLNEKNEFGLDNNDNVVSQLTHHNGSYLTMIIKNIFCGFNYNIYGDGNNNYWSAGYNYYGSCGVGKKDKIITKLTAITIFKKNKIKIKKICVSVAGYCTLWISDKNQLYVNGANDCNQLGIGNKHDQYQPILVPNLGQVIDAASAYNYSLVLCSINTNMIIIYWSRINLIKIMPNDVVNSIKIFYGNTNKVYSTSYSKYGGNGHGKDNKDDGQWKQIEKLSFKKIIKIAAGSKHSLFLESNGSVWCSGQNNDGQLGLSHNNDQYIPTEITYFSKNNIKIKDIECGSYHNLAIDYDDKIYSWGFNKYGQCGNGQDFFGDLTYFNTPKLIHTFKNYKIKSMECGYYHSYVCTHDDNHYLFGSTDYNECIHTDTKNVKGSYLINKIIKDKSNGKVIRGVYLGRFSTIIIVRDINK